MTTSTKRAEAPTSTTITLPAISIELQPGETFCGPLLDERGQVECYPIWMSGDDKGKYFDDALAAAQARGGDLPSPREAWLALAAGVKFPRSWIWLNKREGSSNAWYCYSDGYQGYDDRSAPGGAVAVRRVFPHGVDSPPERKLIGA